MACEKITAGIVGQFVGQRPIKSPCLTPTIPPAPRGTSISTRPKPTAGKPTARRQMHMNWVILDSDWEGEFCRVAENRIPKVRAYVKNHNLGLEVPYRFGSEMRIYRPTSSCWWTTATRDDDPVALGRRDQRLPARGREGKEIHDGHLLDSRREPHRAIWPLGLRRVHRSLSD
jgi:type III restriction enzyme